MSPSAGTLIAITDPFPHQRRRRRNALLDQQARYTFVDTDPESPRRRFIPRAPLKLYRISKG
jgi:hypothetical protein